MSKRKHHTKKKYNKRYRPVSEGLAGKAIAAGGFGCVFKPALKCHGVADRTNGISKMMTIHHAHDEIDEINKFKPYINKIPHADRYFLINNIDLCKPDKLTDADKISFDNKCNNLTRKGYKASNINQKLNDVRILNGPDGGMTIDDWLFKNPDKFTIFNQALIRLLNHGIVPMNNEGLLHCDLKDSNILMGDDNNARIIDWGLAGISKKPPQNPILQMFRDGRPPQYNVPMMSMVLSDSFKLWYERELKILSKDVIGTHEDRLKEIAIKAYYRWINTDGKGHRGYFQEFLRKIYGEKFRGYYYIGPTDRAHIYDCELTQMLIIDQLIQVLTTYTDFKTENFDNIGYFNEVFKPSCDVWGLLTCYSCLFEIDFTKNPIATGQYKSMKHDKFLEALREIFKKYMFSRYASVHKTSVKSVTKDLLKLHTILGTPEPTLKTPTPPAMSPAAPPRRGPPPPYSSGSSRTPPPAPPSSKRSSRKKSGVSMSKRATIFTWPQEHGRRCPRGSTRIKKGADKGKCKKTKKNR